jgi:cephalosporin hydroxylase
VIEIGTKFGGSALWFADMLTTHGIAEGHVVTVDVEPRVGYSDQRIEVVVGDAAMLADALPAARLRTYSKPWLVVEDSSHLFADALAVLEFFDGYLASGDYIVVEDGVLSQFTDLSYERFEDGPNRAVRTFIEQNGDRYEIDTALCDHYGYNVTYNPNGWLRRK